ncbi:transposase family protein [Streptomyces sp. NBC_01077]|uniref:transposase family protein n=1 Tax=Streptomyces sp. NBC_01077 TaxID=2903746 RepID=UPI00386759A9|nr:transposase family protein [Streptomyces sp. NBC_01077]WSV44355.1 transposase family protein [Streptomyces sp. NBC_01077]
MRHGTTHDVLACWFSVDRSTITRAIGDVRPLLAQRGVHRQSRGAAADAGRGRRAPRCEREDRQHRRH